MKSHNFLSLKHMNSIIQELLINPQARSTESNQLPVVEESFLPWND